MHINYIIMIILNKEFKMGYLNVSDWRCRCMTIIHYYEMKRVSFRSIRNVKTLHIVRWMMLWNWHCRMSWNLGVWVCAPVWIARKVFCLWHTAVHFVMLIPRTEGVHDACLVLLRFYALCFVHLFLTRSSSFCFCFWFPPIRAHFLSGQT